MSIFFGNKVTDWWDVADEIGDDGAPVFCLGLGDAQSYISCRKRIGGGYHYRRVAAQQGSDLPSSVFPCNWASAGDARVQGEPS